MHGIDSFVEILDNILESKLFGVPFALFLSNGLFEMVPLILQLVDLAIIVSNLLAEHLALLINLIVLLLQH